MGRRYKITFEWAYGEPGESEQHEYECQSYSLTSHSNLLTMADVRHGDKGFHSIGIPLAGVRRFLVTDRHFTPVRL
jgi:hypothetical protein